MLDTSLKIKAFNSNENDYSYKKFTKRTFRKRSNNVIDIVNLNSTLKNFQTDDSSYINIYDTNKSKIVKIDNKHSKTINLQDRFLRHRGTQKNFSSKFSI